LPPFTRESAIQKVRLAEGGWNTRDPQKVAWHGNLVGAIGVSGGSGDQDHAVAAAGAAAFEPKPDRAGLQEKD
jgi:uncharacterized protein GlcG (DUF336 family)